MLKKCHEMHAFVGGHFSVSDPGFGASPKMLRGSCPNLDFNVSATEESRTIDPRFDAHKKVAAARGGALLGDYMGRGLR